MIYGVGVDLVHVPRLERTLARFGRRFLARCFQPAEADYCLGRPRPASALAMRFAAKEAFAKATGLGMRGIGFSEVEVGQDPAGKPYLDLHRRAQAWASSHQVVASHVSLSDEGEYAMAVVVLEKP